MTYTAVIGFYNLNPQEVQGKAFKTHVNRQANIGQRKQISSTHGIHCPYKHRIWMKTSYLTKVQ